MKKVKIFYFLVGVADMMTRNIVRVVNDIEFKIKNGVLVDVTPLCKWNKWNGVLELPEEVVKIRPELLMDNQFIQKLVCNKNLRSIEKDAFSFCSNLEEVIFNDELEILDSAFEQCPLKRVNLPFGLRFIDPYNFYFTIQEMQFSDLFIKSGDKLKRYGTTDFSPCNVKINNIRNTNLYDIVSSFCQIRYNPYKVSFVILNELPDTLRKKIEDRCSSAHVPVTFQNNKVDDYSYFISNGRLIYIKIPREWDGVLKLPEGTVDFGKTFYDDNPNIFLSSLFLPNSFKKIEREELYQNLKELRLSDCTVLQFESSSSKPFFLSPKLDHLIIECSSFLKTKKLIDGLGISYLSHITIENKIPLLWKWMLKRYCLSHHLTIDFFQENIKVPKEDEMESYPVFQEANQIICDIRKYVAYLQPEEKNKIEQLIQHEVDLFQQEIHQYEENPICQKKEIELTLDNYNPVDYFKQKFISHLNYLFLQLKSGDTYQKNYANLQMLKSLMKEEVDCPIDINNINDKVKYILFQAKKYHNQSFITELDHILETEQSTLDQFTLKSISENIQLNFSYNSNDFDESINRLYFKMKEFVEYAENYCHLLVTLDRDQGNPKIIELQKKIQDLQNIQKSLDGNHKGKDYSIIESYQNLFNDALTQGKIFNITEEELTEKIVQEYDSLDIARFLPFHRILKQLMENSSYLHQSDQERMNGAISEIVDDILELLQDDVISEEKSDILEEIDSLLITYSKKIFSGLGDILQVEDENTKDFLGFNGPHRLDHVYELERLISKDLVGILFHVQEKINYQKNLSEAKKILSLLKKDL